MNEILDTALDELYSSSDDEDIPNNNDSASLNVTALQNASNSCTTSTSSKPLKQDSTNANVEDAVSDMLHNMCRLSGNSDNSSNDVILEKLMAEMEHQATAAPATADYDSMFHNVMNQLLSKEIMYEPMKNIMEAFPKFLHQSKEKLSKEEYERYGHQYQYFQRIVHVYETDPENYAKLTELMQDIQEYGQPPSEILQEVAPGLKFDSDGLPVVDNDNLPLEGMLPPGLNEQDCCIM
eukprot:CAMPEP_0172429108 /NCGR_PEP_ID=MMETSP1064-20121228/49094_1 /TAXON_ID=202472 /ORGANISM="Aulacoseira subarctica , Strain CCAP 1002/5" /LENGTH=236 /DNA_ID=CAMNT_0013174281 /DNA_START=86 /DNA_END=796 /DNA_ORIENTATION=+